MEIGLALCVASKMFKMLFAERLFFSFFVSEKFQRPFFSSFLFETRSERNEKPKKLLGITI